MATSLQKVAPASNQVPLRVETRAPQQKGPSFASALNAVRLNTPSGDSSFPGAAGYSGWPSEISAGAGEDITGEFLADVVQTFVTGSLALFPRRPTTANRPQPSQVSDTRERGTKRSEESQEDRPAPRRTEPREDPRRTSLVNVVGSETTPLRGLGLPAPLSLPEEAASEGIAKQLEGRADQAASAAEAPAENQPVAAEAKGELVFQLALQTPEPDLSPTDDPGPADSPQEQPSVQDLGSLGEAGAEQSFTEDSPAHDFPARSNSRESAPDGPTQQIRPAGEPRQTLGPDEAPAVPAQSAATREALVAPASPVASSPAASPSQRITAPPAATRPAEAAEPQAVRPAAIPLQRMSVVVRGADQSVRLDIRQGINSVRLAVHSGDEALAARLRDSLPELIGRLDERGLQARVMSPSEIRSPLSASVRSEGDRSAGQNSDTWSQDPTRQQHQRNSQRFRRSMAWELQEE